MAVVAILALGMVADGKKCGVNCQERTDRMVSLRRNSPVIALNTETYKVHPHPLHPTLFRDRLGGGGGGGGGGEEGGGGGGRGEGGGRR